MSDQDVKSVEVKRLTSLVPDHRLDYVEAIGMAYDSMEKYDPQSHAGMTPREFFRAVVPERFAWIQNAKVAVETFEILRTERFAVPA